MFSGNRATHSGGASGGGAGALSPWEVALMLLGAATILLIRRRTTGKVDQGLAVADRSVDQQR
jgi:Ca-activated chloride channel family protein